MKTLLALLSSLTLGSAPVLTTMINHNQITQNTQPLDNTGRLELKDGKAKSEANQGWRSWIKESDVWSKSLGDMDQKAVTMKVLDFYSLFNATQIGNLQQKSNKEDISFRVDSAKTDWQTIQYAYDKTEPNGYGFESRGSILWRVVNNNLEIKIKLELWAGSWWIWPFSNTSTTTGYFTWSGTLEV